MVEHPIYNLGMIAKGVDVSPVDRWYKPGDTLVAFSPACLCSVR